MLILPYTRLNAQISPDELQNAILSNNSQTMPLLRAPTSSSIYNSKNELISPVLVDNQAILHENRSNLVLQGISGISNATSTETNEIDSILDNQNDQISVYVVHEGDTIPEIARMFHVSPNTIRWANDLDSKTALKNDQQLIILPISGIKYVVKKGDTLKTIAEQFKGDQKEILSFNDLSSVDLSEGAEIIIPNGEILNTPTPKKEVKKESLIKKAVKNLASKASSFGYFLRPLVGGVKTQGLHGHNGIDFGSSIGTPILASASGQVIISKSGGWNGGYGSYVVIKHSNGLQTLYGHLSSVRVSSGQSVSRGDVIGGMGNTGDSTGVHLHFEVRGGTNPF